MDFRVERCGFMQCVPFVLAADKEGVEIKMGVQVLYWCARRGDGRIVGVAQAWRSGKARHALLGGAWRLSGLFVDPSVRGKGVGFALLKARVSWLRDVQKAVSIDSFAFKPAPLIALGFSPVKTFKMGTTRMLWERASEAVTAKDGGKGEATAKQKRVAKPKVDAGVGWIEAGGLVTEADATPARVVVTVGDGDVRGGGSVAVEAQKKPEPKRVVQLGLGF